MDNNRLFYAENQNDDSNTDFSGDIEYRGKEPPKKPKKLKFKDYKKNTIKSLHDVEYFLNNLDKAFKCVNIYKSLR